MDDKSSIFVRKSTGFVREASFLDAAVFTACFSAPVGATIAFGILWALGAFPGTNMILATILSVALDLPILIMMALMASSMPRTGGDYVWVSRIMSPPIAVVSNFAAALSALIGAAYWARIWSSMGIGPAMTILGNLLKSDALIRIGASAGTTIWTYFAGIFLILVMTLALASGTKHMFKVQNWFFGIAMAGTLLAFAVMAFGSRSSFVTNFNQFAQPFTKLGDSYAGIMEAAKGAGLALGTKANFWVTTLPTVGCIMTFMMWNFWSVYLAGEMKGAGNRSRQLSVMITALIWDAGFIILGVLLLYSIAGQDFVRSINYLSTAAPSKYLLPVAPYFNLFAGMVTKNPLVSSLIGISFVFWNLPAMVGNCFMPVRTVFAWAFDRVLPEKLSEVNERTHSPVPAIILVMAIVALIMTWSTFSSSFFTLLSMGVMCGVIVIAIVGVAAIIFPFKRSEMYRSSPANVQFLGMPLVSIMGVLSIGVMALLVYLLMRFPSLGITSPRLVVLFIVSVVVVGLAIYYIARVVQRKRGIDIDLAYRELPPE